MPKYVKIPSVVDAYKYPGPNPTPEQQATIPDWVIEALEEGKIAPSGLALSVYTDTGPAHCNPGDWLIRSAEGLIWPTSPDYFSSHYREIAE